MIITQPEEERECGLCGGRGEYMLESGPTPDGDVRQEWVKCECRLGDGDR